METSSSIWMDGKLFDWDKANVHVLTYTLHYGLGVFEGIRCYETDMGPAVFRLTDHIERLFNSAHIMKLSLTFSVSEIIEAVKQTINACGFRSCYIRPLIYLGDEKKGLNCSGMKAHIAIAAWPWGTYLGPDALSNGIRVKISSFSRHHVNVSLIKAKTCGNYVNSIMAKLEAVEDGYDEALLLGVDGKVAEGSGENIFIIRNGVLKTPPAVSVLEGITRDSILKIARDIEIVVKEEEFTRDELYIADEAFFCGTAAEITPIREVDTRSIGHAEGRGPITETLQNIYFDTVKGKNDKYTKWLYYI